MGTLDFNRSEPHAAAMEGPARGPSAVGGAALLERVAFNQALGESLASVATGEGRVVLVSGEAGIGKSALVRSFCDAHRDAARVLWGACDALGTPRPLSPLTDIAVTVKGPLLSSVDEGDKPHAVFVALAEELRAVTPTVVVLEDVHWADEATLDVIRLLARRAEALGALIVLTYRDDELDAMHPLRLAVGELGTSPGVVRLRLPPLSRAAVEELAGTHDVDAGELYDQTGGNPFYVTEVLAGDSTEVPPTVRDAVLARMHRLGLAAQGVLEAVAVVPPHVEMWLLDAVVPKEVEHIDACLAAGMLRDEGRTISFRHELARLAVEESIGPRRRVMLHRRVLEALRHPPEGTPDAARLAHHADAAGDSGATLRYATAAGDRAAAQDAATLVLHDPGPSIIPRLYAWIVLGVVRARRGDPQPSELLDRAAALAEQQGQPHSLAAVAGARAELAWLEGRPEDIAEVTQLALDHALRYNAWREAGELCRWRWRAGLREHMPGVFGPDAATLSGDWEEAARLWAEYGCPCESALALGDADDDDALARGLAELHRIGARPAAAILTQRLRERGVRRVPRGPYSAARENPASLTSRELEVLRLVTDGLRNADIAARLVMSRRTVDHHTGRAHAQRGRCHRPARRPDRERRVAPRADGPASARQDVGNLDRRTVRECIRECVHAGGHPCLVAGPDSRRKGGRHNPVAVPAFRAMAIDDHAVVAAVGLLG